MELTAIVLWAQRTSAYKEREQEWGWSSPRGGAAGPEQPALETQELELGCGGDRCQEGLMACRS